MVGSGRKWYSVKYLPACHLDFTVGGADPFLFFRRANSLPQLSHGPGLCLDPAAPSDSPFCLGAQQGAALCPRGWGGGRGTSAQCGGVGMGGPQAGVGSRE